MKFKEYLQTWIPENANQAVFIASLAIILLWIILKVLGIIQTPLIIEVMPLLAAVFAAGAFFSEFRRMVRAVRLMSRAVRQLKIQGHRNEWQHKEINERLAKLEHSTHAH